MKKLFAIIVSVFMVLFTWSIFSFAVENDETLEAKCYEFDTESNYEISSTAPKDDKDAEFGVLGITGDFNYLTDENGVKVYEVNSGVIDVSYKIKNDDLINADDPFKWHLCEDKTKKIDDFSIDNDIMSGAVIIQSSLNHETWITDAVYTDIGSENAEKSIDLYQTKNIQQTNGCYYRVLVVYELEKQIDETKILFIKKKNYDYIRCAEVYEFYLINSDTNNSSISPNSTPRKELGTKINTGKDNGYSGNQEISIKDPHYGWDIGTFFVNGYTREVIDGENSIFLKNVGDRVTLWFRLDQDINKLNGNDKLKISEDRDGYDQYFEIEKTSFKRGALIVRFTDHEGVKHDPILYTDYLAASATTSAETRVELFEEGDYEVALDYEIKSGAASFTNYRIFFTFKVRNSNTMVYPFDIVTNAELNDYALTENGFKLDMARSRYLAIDVKRAVPKKNGDTSYVEDIRYNRSAQDGETYTEEGVYTFTVKNLYTGADPTTKTIFVGSSPIIKALAKHSNDLDIVNKLLAEGAELSGEGELILPEEETSQVLTDADNESPTNNDRNVPVDQEEVTEEKSEDPNLVETDPDSTPKWVIPVLISVILVVIGALVTIALIRIKKRNVEK